MQIFVLGMHRSGTSLITRLINMMGAYFGPHSLALPADAANPKGFWERRDVMAVNDALLAANGCAWNRLSSWPAILPPAPSIAEGKLRAALDALNTHPTFVVKDPRFCLTFDYWRPHLRAPLAVVVYRDPLEIARSLEQRNGMPMENGLALWEYHAVGMLNAMLNVPCVRVQHADALRDPLAFTRSLHADLRAEGAGGLRLPEPAAITEFIDPALYRARADETRTLSPHRRMLAALLRGETIHHSPVDVSVDAMQRMQQMK